MDREKGREREDDVLLGIRLCKENVNQHQIAMIETCLNVNIEIA